MVIDTSIFIDYLRAKDKRETQLFKIPENQSIYLSAVTFYELLMGATTPEKLDDINNITFGISILSFNEKVAEEAGKIYHKLRNSNKLIEFRDIFIAATCIVNDLPILTKNKKHFSRIVALEIQKEYT